MSTKNIVLYLVLSALLLFPITLLADGAPVTTSLSGSWIQTYAGGTNKERADSLIQCADGGYLTAGTTNVSTTPPRTQLWLLKIDAHGNAEWNKTYGSIGSAIKGRVIQTSDGGYALIGTASRKAEVIKTDSAGNLLWNRTFEDSTYASCLIQTSDGEYVLLGSTGGVLPSNGDTIWLVKINQSGDTVWSKTYPNISGGGVTSIIQTKDTGYAAIGSTSMNPDFLLVKLDSNCNFEWSKTFGSQDMDFGPSIVQNTDGSYMMAGLLWNRSTFGGGTVGVGLVKADSAGNQLWLRNYPGRGPPSSMIRGSEGGYILCSSMLDKIGRHGNLLWSKNVSFTGALNDEHADTTSLVVQTSEGGYAVAGNIMSRPSNPLDLTSYVWIGKLDSEGNPTTFIPEFSSIAILILAIAVCFVAVISRNRWLGSKSVSRPTFIC